MHPLSPSTCSPNNPLTLPALLYTLPGLERDANATHPFPCPLPTTPFPYCLWAATRSLFFSACQGEDRRSPRGSLTCCMHDVLSACTFRRRRTSHVKLGGSAECAVSLVCFCFWVRLRRSDSSVLVLASMILRVREREREWEIDTEREREKEGERQRPP